MADILIKKDAGNAEFEHMLKSGALQNITLALPTNLKNAGAMGVSIALTQLLLTWSRMMPQRNLQTWLNPLEHDSFGAFSSRVHGLAASYFSDAVMSINGIDIRRALLESAKPRVQAMQIFDLVNTARGSEIEFIFRGIRQECTRRPHTKNR